jgi:hypothetical protein
LFLWRLSRFANHIYPQGSLFPHPVYNHHTFIFIRLIFGRFPGTWLRDSLGEGAEHVNSFCTSTYLLSSPLLSAVSPMKIFNVAEGDQSLDSGSHTPIPLDTPQEAHREPCVKECPFQHHRSDCHHECSTILGIFLGAKTALVCLITQKYEIREGDDSLQVLSREPRRQLV